jgi:uncharacterized protein
MCSERVAFWFRGGCTTTIAANVKSVYTRRQQRVISKYRCQHFRLPSSSPTTTTRTSQPRRWKSNSSSNTSNSSTPFSTALTSFLVGTLAGVCGSLAGMGGGFIMIPLMTTPRLLGLSQHAAHGTSLFAVATTGLAGALGYQGQVDYQAAACVALAGMVTARAGALATTRLSPGALRKSLGVFMLAVAPLVPAKQYLVPKETEESTSRLEQSSTSPWIQHYVIPAGIGSCSGFLAGLFGVGGGAVVVPALTVLTNMNHYQALGTSLTAMVLPAISGTITHFAKGNVILSVAPFLAMGAFVGAYAGSKLALTIEEESLKYGFSGVMVVLGLRTLLK